MVNLERAAEPEVVSVEPEVVVSAVAVEAVVLEAEALVTLAPVALESYSPKESTLVVRHDMFAINVQPVHSSAQIRLTSTVRERRVLADLAALADWQQHNNSAGWAHAVPQPKAELAVLAVSEAKESAVRAKARALTRFCDATIESDSNTRQFPPVKSP